VLGGPLVKKVAKKLSGRSHRESKRMEARRGWVPRVGIREEKGQKKGHTRRPKGEEKVNHSSD